MELQHTGASIPEENYKNFFESSLCGFLIADPEGIIIKTNAIFANWSGIPAGELKGKRFSDLLAIGGKIYYETHLWPLLRMQGFFGEVLVELKRSAGVKMRVLINAMECRDKNDKPEFIHYIVSKATDRLQYEQNLQHEKAIAEQQLLAEKENVVLREQLIAVLGHDLRNPLSAISMATELMYDDLLNTDNADLLATIKRSSYRMTELINNIMDFARSRLGEGIIIHRKDILLAPVLQQVINELKLVFTNREIINNFDIAERVNCDPDRIGQLLSNLLANALTHGATDAPVHVHASHLNGILKLAVCNSGEQIPEALHERLFAPFTREGDRTSQNGLGLGLYISAEIAKAHNATLTCTSTGEETCFSFEMS